MAAQNVIYRPKKIVNVHKHVDGGWFWNKYSAHPYVGCEYGCEYCYWRDEKYNILAKEKNAKDLDDPFSQYIKIKENAPELLRRELSRLPKDIICTGDYQPVESKFRLSREMLKVCLDLEFPVLINEKSPLVLRDLDLIKEIAAKTWACVLWSISNYKSEGYFNIFEPRLPTIESRFKAMKKVADAGVYTGTAFMPILPFISDSYGNLGAVVRKTAENGGCFVLAGSLTMSGAQADRYLRVLHRHYPHLVSMYKSLYDGGYTPKCEYLGRIGKKVKELCDKYGLTDRMERYVQPGTHVVNKRIAEELFLETYRLQLDCVNKYKIWNYRKAAWAVDEYEKDIKELYENRGLVGLKTISGVGEKIAAKIEDELRKHLI